MGVVFLLVSARTRPILFFLAMDLSRAVKVCLLPGYNFSNGEHTGCSLYHQNLTTNLVRMKEQGVPDVVLEMQFFAVLEPE